MIRRLTEEPNDLLKKRWPSKEAVDSELYAYVASIVDDVRERGDSALLEYTERFDKVAMCSKDLVVRPSEVRDAYEMVSDDQVKALRTVVQRLEALETKVMDGLNFDVSVNGVDIYRRVRPIDKVGCYVPGGKGAYPSTLIMNVVPAKVAGVRKTVVCTPPGRDGQLKPITLVAADICDTDVIYRIGGIQAIAAIAYGTETIERVDKIVGPGNKYVAAAKHLISKDVAIDSPAGPTEILIIADESADARIVALDMISQAEHGAGGVSGLITTSQILVDGVEVAIEEILKDIDKSGGIFDVLAENGFLYLCESMDEAVSFVNRFAPEHLEIQAEEPMEIAEQIINVGLISLGPYTPISATDYCMGTNHVLPTGGYAKIYSGLSALDYVKTVDIIQSSREGLRKVKGEIRALAEAEGLLNHALAVEGRFKE